MLRPPGAPATEEAPEAKVTDQEGEAAVMAVQLDRYTKDQPAWS